MTSQTPRTYQRFDTLQRVEHLVLLVSFTTLAVTGLPQKYANLNWGETLIGLLGGIETTRIIHRVAAIVMMLIAVAHVVEAAYRLVVLRRRPFMLPSLSDARDAWQSFLYNVGVRKEHPRIGRFGFEEKAEYWALVWGTLIMMLTGFMMWNPITTARFLPGQIIPAAKAAHGAEALLAVLAIVLWHFYHVHLKHLNKSMLTGDLSEKEMAEFHPQELADIKTGMVDASPAPQTTRRRQRAFVPVAGVLALGWLVGVYLFATYEHTAITTIPRQDVQIFAPLEATPVEVPPTALPPETAGDGEAAATWEGVQPIFEARCGTCHGTTAGLTLTDYESALAGGDSGPVVVPGDSAGSLLIEKQAAGGHPGQLDDAELDLVRQWIDAGAPGPGGEGAAGDESAAAITWVADVGPLLAEACSACHGTTAGLTLTDYESALAGGDSGPVIEPGDAAASLLVQKQESGGHPGQLDEEQLDLVRQWIDAGAPEGAEETAVTWSGTIQPLLEERCGTCHGTTAGLTLTDYESALAGGNSGPVIVPGDASASLIVQKQEAGGHPGQLDEDELESLRQWIDAGALDD